MANVTVQLTKFPLAPELAYPEAIPRTDTLPWHGTTQHLHSALAQQILGRGACSRNTEMDGNYSISFHGKMKK